MHLGVVTDTFLEQEISSYHACFPANKTSLSLNDKDFVSHVTCHLNEYHLNKLPCSVCSIILDRFVIYLLLSFFTHE